MAHLRLYTTLGCHLCEQAEQLLNDQQAIADLDWDAIEIADTQALIETYGVRIPVLQWSSNACELGWPFTAEQLHRWLQAQMSDG